MDSEGIVIEGLQVVVVTGVPLGYAGVYEPGCQANPGTEPVIVVDLDTYVRLDANEELACELVREMAINAKRALKIKQQSQDRQEAKNARRLQRYVGPQ